MQTFKKIVIYFLLWSFGILTFPVLLFLNWKNKDKSYKNYLVASGIGFGMFLIVLPFTDESDTASTQEVAQEEEQAEGDDEEEDEAEDTEEEKDEENEEPEEEQGLEDKVKAVADDVLDDRATEARYVEDTGFISIEFQIRDSFTNNQRKFGFLSDAHDYTEQIQNEDFDRILFSGFFDTRDQYGNVENTKVATLDMNKETVDKINFDNIIPDDMENIADEIYFHPALLDLSLIHI